MSTFASALGGKERQNTFSPFPFFQKKYFLKKILCKKIRFGFFKKNPDERKRKRKAEIIPSKK